MKYSIADAKRLVIKIGSSLLVNNKTSVLHHEWLKSLIHDIMECWKRGQQILIVSSGAIALGRCHLQFKNHNLQLEEQQAAAAVGQIKLAHAYQEMLKTYGITAAQILLTIDDTENRHRFLNAKNTLETLLTLKAIPIINENDTVATDEICYGDNDRLAARVAQMVNADTLILLSDIDGLYTANPQLDDTAQLIPEVTELTPDILAMAGDSATDYGSGGMITKLAAAKIALASGCKMVISAGKHFHPLKHIDETNKHTWFIPQTKPIHAHKNWIAHHLSPKGRIIIDNHALELIRDRKILLSSDIINIEGDFQKGDAIDILTSDNQPIARGLVNYAAHEVKKILGRNPADYETILGYQGCEEIIDQDNLVFNSE
jgi:glutamate 5-kinase